MIVFIYIITSYLLGAIPVGYLLTKSVTGKNIMEHGSGNIGSTNVKRIVGKKTATHTQLLDMSKGLLPVLVFLLLNNVDRITLESHWIYPIAMATIIGHSYSPFLKFKGGKSVNTTLGASILISPITVLVAVVIYYLVKWRFSIVSLGSLAIAITLPTFEFIFPFHYQFPFIDSFFSSSLNFYYFVACSVLIIFRHKNNIIRLIKNEESKV